MPASDGPRLPVSNCVLCGWPMNGTINILEVRVGAVAVYRACADECPPVGVDRRRYIADREAQARRLDREIGQACRSLADYERQLDLIRRQSVLLGLYAPRQVEVVASSATGLSAREVVKRVREQLRREDDDKD